MENLASSAVGAVCDLTKRAIFATLDTLIFRPVKAIGRGVLDAILTIPCIPISVPGEPKQAKIAPGPLFR
jgi:hypothetical protein